MTSSLGWSQWTSGSFQGCSRTGTQDEFQTRKNQRLQLEASFFVISIITSNSSNNCLIARGRFEIMKSICQNFIVFATTVQFGRNEKKENFFDQLVRTRLMSPIHGNFQFFCLSNLCSSGHLSEKKEISITNVVIWFWINHQSIGCSGVFKAKCFLFNVG